MSSTLPITRVPDVLRPPRCPLISTLNPMMVSHFIRVANKAPLRSKPMGLPAAQRSPKTPNAQISPDPTKNPHYTTPTPRIPDFRDFWLEPLKFERDFCIRYPHFRWTPLPEAISSRRKSLVFGPKPPILCPLRNPDHYLYPNPYHLTSVYASHINNTTHINSYINPILISNIFII